jgi:hypothetical protein
VVDVRLQAFLLERRDAASPARTGLMDDDELGNGLGQGLLQQVDRTRI